MVLEKGGGMFQVPKGVERREFQVKKIALPIILFSNLYCYLPSISKSLDIC